VSEAIFKTPSGRSPTEYILELAAAAVPTAGDAIYAAQRQRSRILERTANGVDVDGAPFEPYSTKGPYYFYPNGRVGKNKASVTRNKAAVSRLLRRLAGTGGLIDEMGGKSGSGGSRTRGGEGIKFDSYADFKRSLGRLGVDLRGPRAPHMLQAIAIGTGIERVVGDDLSIGLNERSEQAVTVVIGIYGEEAGRATGHNTGENPRWKSKHQRRFLGASDADLKAMGDDMGARIAERVALGKA
jgi:hypothetical protein